MIGDNLKVAIPWQLQLDTTMTYRWIAMLLAMGRWTTVANLRAAKRKGDGRE